MAVTVTDIARGTIGHKRMALVQVTFDNSYPTGGEDFTPGQVGMSEFNAVFADAGDRNVEYDYPNKKLLVFQAPGGAAHTHTENTAAAYTQNATTGSAGAVAAGPNGEVAAATDLSAFTTRLFVIGS